MKFITFIYCVILVVLISVMAYVGIYLEDTARLRHENNENKTSSSIQEDKQQSDRAVYEFHYVGNNEEFKNVYVTYRFNKLTGEILRFHYTHDEDKSGQTEYERIGYINLNSGEDWGKFAESSNEKFKNKLETIIKVAPTEEELNAIETRNIPVVMPTDISSDEKEYYENLRGNDPEKAQQFLRVLNLRSINKKTQNE